MQLSTDNESEEESEGIRACLDLPSVLSLSAVYIPLGSRMETNPASERNIIPGMRRRDQDRGCMHINAHSLVGFQTCS